MKRRKLFLLLLLPLLLLTVGCTREEQADCPQAVELSLRVVVEGEDITDQGAVKSLSLYVFDNRKEFLRRLDAQMGEPMHLYFPDQDTLYVVSWGNLTEERQRLPMLSVGTPLYGAKVRLRSATEVRTAVEARTAATCPIACEPDDLFYSSDRLSLKSGKQSVYQLEVDRVVGSMAITMRQLQNYANYFDENYHLVVRETYDAIDFDGQPTESEPGCSKVGYRPAVHFDAQKELIAPLFNLLPSHAQGVIEIDIYHGDTFITTVKNDSKGEALKVVRGKVLNVLVDFQLQIEVKVSLTPWGETQIWKDF